MSQVHRSVSVFTVRPMHLVRDFFATLLLGTVASMLAVIAVYSNGFSSILSQNRDASLSSEMKILSGYTKARQGINTGLQAANHSAQPCRPRVNVVFLKTHKTGSSTVQNILYRFGDVRGLSFVLPSVDVYMGNPRYFSSKFIVQNPGRYNILANHARFHKENMDKIMPTDTKYISIIRFPPNQFESMYSYYNLMSTFHSPLESFSANAEELYSKYEAKNPRHSALNPMLYDLGLSKNNLTFPSQIDKWIQYIDKTFDLILVAEYLQESLVLLKELMCWSLEDVAYFSSNMRNPSLVTQLTDRTMNQLLQWHNGDYKLYQHFNKTLHQKIEQYGKERLKREVGLLNKRNLELAGECLEGTKPVKELGGKTIIDRYVLKSGAKHNPVCSRMTYTAYNYLTILRKKQKNMRLETSV